MPFDYVLKDWKQAGLPKPSFVRPKVAAIEPTLVVHQVGQLSALDVSELDRRLRLAMSLTESALTDVVSEIDFEKQPPAILQVVAEKSVSALVTIASMGNTTINVEQIRRLL